MQNSFMQQLLSKPDGFNAYSLGDKHYGIMGSPQRGPMSGSSLVGYRQRDMELKARKKAYLDKMQSMNSGNYGSPVALRSY